MMDPILPGFPAAIDRQELFRLSYLRPPIPRVLQCPSSHMSDPSPVILLGLLVSSTAPAVPGPIGV